VRRSIDLLLRLSPAEHFFYIFKLFLKLTLFFFQN